LPGVYIPPHHPDQSKGKQAQMGIWWPAADSDKLRTAAQAWREMARALDAVEAAAQPAVLNLLADNQGPAMDAFAAYWQRWSGGSGYLPTCSQACNAMAKALDEYAQAVDDARVKVEELVAEVATAVVLGVVLGVCTVGIATAAAGAVSEGLIASAALVGIGLTQSAGLIIGGMVAGATFGAVEAMAIDAGAIQAEKIWIFKDQKEFNWNEVWQWGEMGAAGGFVGGALGAGVSALRRGWAAAGDGLGAAGDGVGGATDSLGTTAEGVSAANAGAGAAGDSMAATNGSLGAAGDSVSGGITARLRGGAGLVYQGQAGVKQAIADLESSGGRVMGYEITLDVNKVRTRLDLFVKLPNGKNVFLEIKTGPEARLTPNQTAAFPGIRQGGAIPAGQRASDALLDTGVPLGPTEVWVVNEPWPLGG
jgi:hypothetical protein